MRIDNNGLLKLPKDALEFLDISEKTDLFFSIEGDKLVVRKKINGCSFCGVAVGLIGIGKHFVCERCRDKLSRANVGDYIY